MEHNHPQCLELLRKTVGESLCKIQPMCTQLVGQRSNFALERTVNQRGAPLRGEAAACAAAQRGR